MEKFSAFKRVVGAVPEIEKQEILNNYATIFAEQGFSDLEGIEREKTPEEYAILELANNATDDILRKYGVEKFPIPANNVHIIKEENWPDKKGSAIYNSMAQAVAIREVPAKIVFLKKVFHEMLHFKSYNALQVTIGDNPEADKYRVGLTVASRDGEKQYFKFLNEAVTEELTKRYTTKLFDDPLFQEDRKRTLEIKERYPDIKNLNGQKLLLDEEVIFADTVDSDTWKDAVGRVFGQERNRKILSENFTYVQERAFLNSLVERIYQENHEEFKDAEEVFDLFAQAAFTGNMLRIGKLIDRTFGSGTFRKIGEMEEGQSVQKELHDLLQVDLRS